MSPVISVDNYRYYVVFVDHFTRYSWLYPSKTKSQVRDVFTAFKALVESKFNLKIGTLYSDNGGEYMALKSFLSAAGISHLTSPPHTPEHNGVSERKHRHVVETGLSLLSHERVLDLCVFSRNLSHQSSPNSGSEYDVSLLQAFWDKPQL